MKRRCWLRCWSQSCIPQHTRTHGINFKLQAARACGLSFVNREVFPKFTRLCSLMVQRHQESGEPHEFPQSRLEDFMGARCMGTVDFGIVAMQLILHFVGRMHQPSCQVVQKLGWLSTSKHSGHIFVAFEQGTIFLIILTWKEFIPEQDTD